MLEDFCSLPDFTNFLQEFAQKHCVKFQDESEEQPIECYTLWQQFTKHVDSQLDEFLQQNGLEAEKVMASIQRMQEHDQGILSAIDYLLASTDYQEFVNMMLDFKDMGLYVDNTDSITNK